MQRGSLCPLEKFSTLEQLGERVRLLIQEARELEASQAEWASDLLDRAQILDAIIKGADTCLRG